MYLIIEIIGSDIFNYNLEKHNRVCFDIPPMEPRTNEGSLALRRTPEFTIYDPFIFGNNKLPQICVMPSKNNANQAYCIITNTVVTSQYENETFGPYTTIILDSSNIYANYYCRLYLASNNLFILRHIYNGFYDNLHREKNPELYELPPDSRREDQTEESDWDTT